MWKILIKRQQGYFILRVINTSDDYLSSKQRLALDCTFLYRETDTRIYSNIILFLEDGGQSRTDILFYELQIHLPMIIYPWSKGSLVTRYTIWFTIDSRIECYPYRATSRWRVSANSSIVRAFTKGGEKAGTCRGHVRDKTIEARYPISRMLGRVSTQPSGLLARDNRSSLLLKKPALFLARTTHTHTRARDEFRPGT